LKNKIGLFLTFLVVGLVVLGGVYAAEVKTQINVTDPNYYYVYDYEVAANLTYTPGMIVTIPVRVTEIFSGDPVPNLYMTLRNDNGVLYNCRSDRNGEAKLYFEPSGSGTYDLSVGASSYGPWIGCSKFVTLYIK
jgi:hypothetical protein